MARRHLVNRYLHYKESIKCGRFKFMYNEDFDNKWLISGVEIS